MKRWQISLGFAGTALAAALIAPRLMPRLQDSPVDSPPHEPIAEPVSAPVVVVDEPAPDPRTIDLVIALDTSGSMERLIDSTRARLWDIVNEIDAQDPDAILRVGLLAYGTPQYGEENGYVKVVMPLTDDLDALYTAAWSLHTEGGDEYVGAVVRHALTDLEWAPRQGDNRRLLFVAGNETAALGPIPYHQAAAEAVANGLQVSTLFAGNDRSGRSLQWDSVARAGNGRYMAIDASLSAVAVQTPYDARLETLNRKLNGTYVAGNRTGRRKLQRLLDNDANANAMGGLAGRVASKGSGKFKTDSWDLVDQVESGSFRAAAVDRTALPGDLANLEDDDLVTELKDRAKARDTAKNEIQEIQKQRSQWIAQQAAAEEGEGMDEAMNEILTDLL